MIHLLYRWKKFLFDESDVFVNAIIDNWAQHSAGYHSGIKLANYSCYQCLKSWLTFWTSPLLTFFFLLIFIFVKVFFTLTLGLVCFCLLLKPKHSGYNWHYREGSAARNCFLSRVLIKLSARLWGWNSGGTSDQTFLSLAHWQAMTLKDWIWYSDSLVYTLTCTHTQTCTHRPMHIHIHQTSTSGPTHPHTHFDFSTL